MVQGEDLPAAEKQIQRAIQLEPDNQSYLLSLAQVNWREATPPPRAAPSNRCACPMSNPRFAPTPRR